MNIYNYFENRSRSFLIMHALFFNLLLASMDYLTGWEFAFSPFYLLPILLVTWFSDMSAGMIISVISAFTWLTVDFLNDHPYSTPFFALWNMLARLFFYLIIAYSLSIRRQKEKYIVSQSRELERSNKELAMSIADLEQFTTAASHDLKEPLRVVSQYLQIIEQRCKNNLDPDISKFINSSINAAGRMDTLINDLLDYSRVIKKERHFLSVNCSKILNEALNNLTVTISQSGTVITSDPLPTLSVVESEFVRIFQNLIGNAIKYRGQDTPRVHISAKSKEGRWVFSIKDNGIGIESQYYQKIFNIFQRLHSREEYPGTGIGLAICKKIVESYGGQIWVESEPGKGSTFYFTIPK
ncbi:MAG: GHKL domain-containing protein [Elusimicrobia bacterium]|nr:GHKL domain-containing protein [Candidatus Obscuribacterium magneticum]